MIVDSCINLIDKFSNKVSWIKEHFGKYPYNEIKRYGDDSSTDYNVPDVDKFMEPKTSKESVQQPVYDPNQYDVQANTSTDGRFEPYSPYGTFSMDKKY